MTEERRKEHEHDTLLAVMASNIENIKIQIAKLEGMMENKFVTKEEFEPIKKIVYGLVALVMTSVFVAILALIIK